MPLYNEIEWSVFFDTGEDDCVSAESYRVEPNGALTFFRKGRRNVRSYAPGRWDHVYPRSEFDGEMVDHQATKED